MATFGYVLLGMALDVSFGCFSLALLSQLTWLLGRRVHFFDAAAAAAEAYRDLPDDQTRQRAHTFIAFTMMALIIALIFIIVGHSLPHTLRNYAIFLVAAGVAIRLACVGMPGASEPSNPRAGKGWT